MQSPHSFLPLYRLLLWHRFRSATTENSTRAKMSSTVQALVALVSVIILLADGQFCKVAALGPPSPCSSTATSLSLCLPAVQGANPPFPTDECCAAVRTTDTGCLCNIVTEYSGIISSMGVNVSAALLLPKNCKHVLPAGYNCDGNSHASTQLYYSSLYCYNECDNQLMSMHQSSY